NDVTTAILKHDITFTSQGITASYMCFFFQAEDGIRDFHVTGVQTCALPISMEPWSITPPRFSAMVLIRHNADMKLTELARAMGIARSGAVEVVNSLEKLGYVKRCDSRTDRRAYALALTQEGAASLKIVTRQF